MKTTLFTSLAVLLAATPSAYASWDAKNITIDDTIHLLAGVMNGIIHEDHIDYMLGCVNGTEAMVGDIESMVSDFGSGTFWGITDGLLDIKRFVTQDLPIAIVDCGDIPDDFTKLDQFFSIFSNSTLLSQRVTYNFLWYYSQIMTNFNAAEAAWNAGLYFECGTKLGDALVDAVGDHSQSMDRQAVVRRAIENRNVPAKVSQILALMKVMQ